MNSVKKKILLVRHGATGYNEADLLQGRIDNPLSPSGRNEADLLAKRLQAEKIEIIFSSPLARAVETAEIINRFHRAPVQIIDPFIEIDMGEWDGSSFSTIQERDVSYYQRWVADPKTPAPGGESFSQVYRRVNRGIRKVLAASEQHILITAHATVNRAILGNLLHMPPAVARQFRIRNAALSKLVVYENSGSYRIVVDSWNDTSHLEARL